MKNTCLRSRPVASVLAVVLVSGGAAASELMPMYGAVVRGPSVPLSYVNGASPYSGVGRYDGPARCTAFFLDTAGSFVDPDDPAVDREDAPAYAVTAGRCVTGLAGDGVVIDGAGSGRIVFNYFADSERRQLIARVVATAYAEVRERNVALLELEPSYAELVAALIRPLPAVAAPRTAAGDPVAVIGTPLGSPHGEGFLRLAYCRIDGIAPVVVEDRWRWEHTPFHRCRDVGPGSAGSPVLSVIARGVVGVIGATTAGAGEQGRCALGHPCERADGRTRSRPETHYVSAVAGLGRCFDARGHFDLRAGACPLAPEPAPAGEHLSGSPGPPRF